MNLNFSDYNEISIYIKHNREKEIIEIAEEYFLKEVDFLPEDLFFVIGFEPEKGIIGSFNRK